MSSKSLALAVGAVTAGALAVGGWLGYQHRERQVASGEVLRGYDAHAPASTAPHTENIFTGRVTAFEGQRDIEGWTQDVYRVEVASVLRGNLRGTVRVTYGLDEGTAERLADGTTYLFATHAWADPAKDGHAQLYQGPMKPVDTAQLTAWKEAATLPVAPDR
ncbi:hypothetical protein ACFY7C_12615 [Streptomyces sp. NPDC012769]|uniref:hypothetical protein n=1 Tax=Streptomyces sp. NPDC012769 TaxID=3364848 RepID=UPI0036AD0FB0